ncbi:hypothetical protein FRC03_009843 [Tulasnella sp. 419]|nr:hypothetical protein FRC03_009843 [Tulasnella sp. 419]
MNSEDYLVRRLLAKRKMLKWSVPKRMMYRGGLKVKRFLTVGEAKSVLLRETKGEGISENAIGEKRDIEAIVTTNHHHHASDIKRHCR